MTKDSTGARRHVIGRRAALQALGGLGGLVLSGCAVTRPADPGRVEARQVAPGVWVLPGAPGDVDNDNLGRTGNAGFIVGRTGVLAINSGVSHRHGQALLAALQRVTPLPVRGLVLTHALQDFIFGATAYQAAGIPVYMHRNAARLMASRCEGCLKTLRRELGDAEMAGTEVPRAKVEFSDALAARSLPDIGRPVRIVTAGPEGHSASPGNAAVLDEETGTLFAGALLDADSIPDVQDADFPGWRAGLRALGELPLMAIVPGRGPVSPPTLVATVGRYLDGLEKRTAELLAAGTALSDIAEATQLSEFSRWARYETTHRRNASIVFLRQERALMFQTGTSSGNPSNTDKR